MSGDYPDCYCGNCCLPTIVQERDMFEDQAKAYLRDKERMRETIGRRELETLAALADLDEAMALLRMFRGPHGVPVGAALTEACRAVDAFLAEHGDAK